MGGRGAYMRDDESWGSEEMKRCDISSMDERVRSRRRSMGISLSMVMPEKYSSEDEVC